MRKTFFLTLSAMLSALGVVILLLGGLLDVLDMSAAVLASFIILFAHREMPRPAGALVFGVTALLSFLLLPNRTAALFYLAFAGWYPLVKYRLDHLPRPLSAVLKLLLFNVALAAVFLALFYLLSAPAEATHIYLLMFLVGNVAFVLYDILLARVYLIYAARWRARVQRLLYK